jgi:hypothetical protein
MLKSAKPIFSHVPGTVLTNRSRPKEEVEKIRSAMGKKQAVSVGRMDEQGGGAIRVGKHDDEPRTSWKRRLEAVKKSSVILSEAKNLLLSF